VCAFAHTAAEPAKGRKTAGHFFMDLPETTPKRRSTGTRQTFIRHRPPTRSLERRPGQADRTKRRLDE
jgi:hypothetical protein